MPRKRLGIGEHIPIATPQDVVDMGGNSPYCPALLPENEERTRAERRGRNFNPTSARDPAEFEKHFTSI